MQKPQSKVDSLGRSAVSASSLISHMKKCGINSRILPPGMQLHRRMSPYFIYKIKTQHSKRSLNSAKIKEQLFSLLDVSGARLMESSYLHGFRVQFLVYSQAISG